MFKRFLLSGFAVLMVFSLGISSALAAPVQSGQLSISVNPKVVDPLVAGQKDVSVLDFKLVAGDVEDILINEMELYFVPLQTSTPKEAIGTAKIVEKSSGEVLSGPFSFADDKTILLNDTFEMQKGETMNVIAVISASAMAKPGDAFLPCVRSAKGLGSSSLEAVKGSFATQRCGSPFAFAKADLIVSLNASSPSAQEVPAGMSDVKVATFNFSAVNEDMKVDELHFKYLPLDGDVQVKGAYLIDEDGVMIGTNSFIGNKDILFDDLDFVIKKDETKQISLIVDLYSLEEGGDSSESFYFQLDFVEVQAEISGDLIKKDVAVNTKTVTIQ